MNNNTSKKGIVALERNRTSPKQGMESLKIEKVLINSSQAPSTKIHEFQVKFSPRRGGC